jgi:hypothetical protein
MEKWKIPISQLRDWDSSCDFAINASSKWKNGKWTNGESPISQLRDWDPSCDFAITASKTRK